MNKKHYLKIRKLLRFLKNNFLIVIFLTLTLISYVLNSFLFLIISLVFLTIIVIGYRIFILIQQRKKGIPGAGLNLKVTFILVSIAVVPSLILTYSFEYYLDILLPKELGSELAELRRVGVDSQLYSPAIKDKIVNISSLIDENFDENDPRKTFKDHSIDLDFFALFKEEQNKLNILYSMINRMGKHQIDLNDNDLKSIYYKIIRDKNFIQNRSMSVPRLSREKGFSFFMMGTDVPNIYIIGGYSISNLELEIADRINDITKLVEQSKVTARHAIEQTIFIISIPIIILALLIGLVFSRSLLKPIEELLRATKQIARGALSYRIRVKRKDELGSLMMSFNDMAEELQKNKNELYKIEKLAAWRDVAKRLAHEFKNPLTPIKLAGERLKRSYGKTHIDYIKILDKCTYTITSEVDRLINLVNEFSDFSKLPRAKIEKHNLIETINDIIELYEVSGKKISFETDYNIDSEMLIIEYDRKQIKQVLINLIQNGIDSIEGKERKKIKGTISVKVTKFSRSNQDFCKITISDTGTGIPDNVRHNLFEPYFSTKKKGTGLGLAIVKSIIDEHNGDIYFESVYNEGTSFFIEIPIIQNTGVEKDE